MIATVAVDHLMCAVRKASADRADGSPPDVAVSVVSALHDKCGPQEMIAINCRLTALANLIVAGDGKAWTIDVDGQEYTLVSDALVRAAATAPLTETSLMSDLRFGSYILDIALELVEPHGSA